MVLEVLSGTWYHLILTKALWRGYYYYPHLIFIKMGEGELRGRVKPWPLRGRAGFQPWQPDWSPSSGPRALPPPPALPGIHTHCPQPPEQSPDSRPGAVTPGGQPYTRAPLTWHTSDRDSSGCVAFSPQPLQQARRLSAWLSSAPRAGRTPGRR